jgi:hypothetical protein
MKISGIGVKTNYEEKDLKQMTTEMLLYEVSNYHIVTINLVL